MIAAFGFLCQQFSYSQVVTPFTARFSQNTKGDIVLTGNTLVTCPSCNRNGTGDNNDYSMIYVDVDADATTFNSSSANLNLPAGASVIFAGLYWGADTATASGGSAAPTPANRNRVLFQTPISGSYTTTIGSLIGASGSRYTYFYNATSTVQAAGNGAYTVANIQAGTGADRYAGWSLVIAYRLASDPLRNLTVFDGYASVDSGDPNLTLSVSGFLTPPSGRVVTRLGTIAFEGDRSKAVDRLRLNNTIIGNALSPSTNYFNSSITDLGIQITNKNPNYSNQLGFDIDRTDASGILPNSSTSATINLTTSDETYYPLVVTFATNIYSPDITLNKSAVDLNGGTLDPGDTIEYRVPVQNAGGDAATNVVVTDPLPSNVTYVPGTIQVASGANSDVKTDAAGDDQAEYVAGTRTITLRAGTGATASAGGTLAIGESTELRFRVVVNTDTAGQQIINQPSITYTGATGNQAFTQPGPTVQLQVPSPNSDLSITKTNGVSSVASGASTTYTIVVTNNGPDQVMGAVVDNPPLVLNSPTWTCTSSSGSSCAAASGTGNINTTVDLLPLGTATFLLTGTVNSTATGTITNTATVTPSGGTAGDPDPSNNTATDTDQLTPIADLSIVKTNSRSDVVRTRSVTYTITATNNGPDAITGATVTDTLPSSLTGATWTCVASAGSSCATASGTGNINTLVNLLNNGTATFTLTATVASNAASPVENSASITPPAGATDSILGNNSSTDSDPALTPTAVDLISFSAATDNSTGRVLLKWRTGGEVNNLGFNVYRVQNNQRTQINSSLIAGSALIADAPLTAGNGYAWWDQKIDDTTKAEEAIEYWLEDVDLSGARTLHGPVTAQISALNEKRMSQSQLLENLSNQKQFASSNALRESLPELSKETSFIDSNEEISFVNSNKKANFSARTMRPITAAAAIGNIDAATRAALKINVNQYGWYRVSAASLLTASNPANLKLSTDGVEQPIRVNSDQSVEFYGRAFNSLSTDERVYWLTVGDDAGLRIPVMSAAAPESVESIDQPSFLQTIERRDRTIYFSSLLNGARENIFGPVVSSNQPTLQTLTVTNLSEAGATTASLEIALQGVTEADHDVAVKLNGVDLGVISFSHHERGVQQFSLSAASSSLRAGENIVSLQSLNAGVDVNLIDYIKLNYPRLFKAENNRLQFSAEAGRTVKVNGFTRADVKVFDVTNPQSVSELLVTGQPDETGSFAFRLPAAAQNRFLMAVAGNENYQNPVKVVANNRSSLRASTNGANFVIITHHDFLTPAQRLAAVRNNQGLRTTVVDVEDVFDEFSFGAHKEQAIRDFVKWTQSKWSLAPQYVLLMGDATWDPKNYLSPRTDYVPTRLIDTVFMETASDDWFVDFNDDNLPDIAVGRLPVATASEAELVVSKIINANKTVIGAARKVVFVADNGFETLSRNLQQSIPRTMLVNTINRSSAVDSEIRSQILTGINNGPAVVNFTGHGSVDVWTGGAILKTEDAALLTNQNSLPVMVMLTCLNGYFQDANIPSLGEAMLLSPTGGAHAVIASTGMTDPQPQSVMARKFFKEMIANNRRLGNALKQAKAATTSGDVRRTWVLLGDPTMQLR